MSQENIELVSAICTPWERGDFTEVGWADPEIELVFADGPTPGTSIGVAAMRATWREALSAFDRLDVEIERYVPLEGGRVLVLMHNRGTGKTSGFDLGDLQTRGANVFHVRDGKVTKLVLYWDRARAFDDLGLPADSMNANGLR